MENCFAYGNNGQCSALRVKKCEGFQNCRFYKTRREHELGIKHEMKVSKCKVCGGNIRIKSIFTGVDITGYKIVCYDCGLQTRVFDSKTKLINYWNGDVDDDI